MECLRGFILGRAFFYNHVILGIFRYAHFLYLFLTIQEKYSLSVFAE